MNNQAISRNTMVFTLIVIVLFSIWINVIAYQMLQNKNYIVVLSEANENLEIQNENIFSELEAIRNINSQLREENTLFKEANTQLTKEKEQLTKEKEQLANENSFIGSMLAASNKSSEILQEELKQIKLELEEKNKIIAGQKASSVPSKTIVSGDGKTVYFTFDDGPSKNTEKILDILKEHDIKATFFVIGKSNMKHVYKRIVDEGHTIGNHTYTHNYEYIYSSPDNFKKDLERLERLIYESTGKVMDVFRFPGGSNNYTTKREGGLKIIRDCISVLEEKGYQYYDWNIDSTDAKVATQKKEKIINSVLNNMPQKSDAIVLFHDTSSKTTTVEALPVIIEELKRRGYKFERMTKNVKPVQFVRSGSA